jgi:hypothetical protein
MHSHTLLDQQRGAGAARLAVRVVSPSSSRHHQQLRRRPRIGRYNIGLAALAALAAMGGSRKNDDMRPRRTGLDQGD